MCHASSLGQESFQVDPEGILPTSLRGIGQAILGGLEGLVVGNQVPFSKEIEPDAQLQLPDGIARTFTDPAIQSALSTIFQFAPGTDASAIFQVRTSWSNELLGFSHSTPMD